MEISITQGKAFGVWLNENYLKLYYRDIDKIRLIGVLNINTKIFKKKANMQEHYLRNFQSFGLSEDVYKILKLYECKFIIIKTNTKEEYAFRLNSFSNSYKNNNDLQYLYAKIDSI